MMSAPRIFILGGGVSGLIAANYLKHRGFDFRLITTEGDGFSYNSTSKYQFRLGQRTMFYDSSMRKFFSEVGIDVDTVDLGEEISLYYRKKLYSYPIQNSIGRLPLWEQVKFYWDYLNRKRSKHRDYYHWVMSNYGRWLSEEILIPHTWKTLKEDLNQIDAIHYGHKVIKYHMWGNKKHVAFDDPAFIMKMLRENVKDKIINGRVGKVYPEECKIEFLMEGNNTSCIEDYNAIVNSISLLSMKNLIDAYDNNNVLEVAFYGLNYNNMFLGVFVVPNTMVNTDKKIIYFPERDYIFSKVNIEDFKNNYKVISCECSFRRNDNDKFSSAVYRERFLDKIENDLRKAGLLDNDVLSSFHRDYKIISPCYIVTDQDYGTSNNFIQSYMESSYIYNIGRFAQWQPQLRAEHSLQRIKQIVNEELNFL